MGKFQIGDTFTWTDWFTGGLSTYTVIDRTEDTLFTECIDRELDGTHVRKEKFTLERDEKGEKILMCEYKCTKGYIEATDLQNIKNDDI